MWGWVGCAEESRLCAKSRGRDQKGFSRGTVSAAPCSGRAPRLGCLRFSLTHWVSLGDAGLARRRSGRSLPCNPGVGGGPWEKAEPRMDFSPCSDQSHLLIVASAPDGHTMLTGEKTVQGGGSPPVFALSP